MPDTLGHYELLERIGAGALGEVFRARDTRVGRTVVIKRVPAGLASDPGRRAGLERAAHEAATLSHPHLARLYELGDDQGQLYLALEHVPGDALAVVTSGHALNVRRAVEIALQVADGLAEAHAAGIVHRDVNPANIVVTHRGQAKLLDMGLGGFTGGGAVRAKAALLEAHEGVSSLRFRYLSPEEALGEPADHRSDLFALGAVLYEMLTGTPAFEAPDAAGTVVAVVQATPAPPSARNSEVPADLDAVVARALAKSLGGRYQTAAEMAAALRDVLETLEARTSAPDPTPLKAAKVSAGGGGGRRLLLVVGLVVVLALVAWMLRGQWMTGGV